jgi:hypothetical protein
MADFPLVTVEWNDAWGSKDDEVTLEDVASSHKPTIVRTIGWLVYEDAEGVSVFNETYEGKYRGRTFIPRAMIRPDGIQLIVPRKRARKPKSPPTATPA